MGALYSHVGVSGPHEFAELPRETQLFWNAWFDERLRRGQEMADGVDTI